MYADAVADALTRCLDRIVRKMGVACGGLQLGMTEQFPDHWEPLAKGQGAGREGGEEIVSGSVMGETPDCWNSAGGPPRAPGLRPTGAPLRSSCLGVWGWRDTQAAAAGPARRGPGYRSGSQDRQPASVGSAGACGGTLVISGRVQREGDNV